MIPKHDYAFISNFADRECLTPFLGMFVVSGLFFGSRRLTPIPPTYQTSEILASYRQFYKLEIKQNQRYSFWTVLTHRRLHTPFLGMFVVSGVFSGSRRPTPIPPTYQTSEILASYMQLYK